MLHFADLVLARATLERLSERQVELVLDALEGHEVEWSDADREALLEFARVVRAEFGDVPAFAEVEAVVRSSVGASRVGGVTLLPVSPNARTVTLEDVRALQDDIDIE